MKDYRFYAEMPEERGSKSGSKMFAPFTVAWLRGRAAMGGHNNCIAVLVKDGKPLYNNAGTLVEAVAPTSELSNAGVSLHSIDPTYLRQRCVRIDAELARKLHPNLFSLIG